LRNDKVLFGKKPLSREGRGAFSFGHRRLPQLLNMRML
jgi:hypothetical protein